LKANEKQKLAVACAADVDVLKAVGMAVEKEIVEPILVGDELEIRKIAYDLNLDLSQIKIIDEKDKGLACEIAVKLVSSKEAGVLMKGLVDTSVILKAVLNKEWGLRTGNVLSHVAVLEVPHYDRVFYLTDGAMNIAPDLKAKQQIVENAVSVAHALGNEVPNVGMLAAIEKVNPKMEATTDAHSLVELNKEGIIKGCKIGGPFALDNAISLEAAKHKGMTDPMAGLVDVLVVPQIESGNVLYKSMIYFAGGKSAGVIMGATNPVVLTSRADSSESKLYSIALGAMVAQNL
jgi:phosphate butyryltransferase